jgi:hypothetical protein
MYLVKSNNGYNGTLWNESMIDLLIREKQIDGPKEQYLTKPIRRVCGKTWKEVKDEN